MKVLRYYCSAREARQIYPNEAANGQQVVVQYEPLPLDPDLRRVCLWDGRVVIAVHITRRMATIRRLSDGGRSLRPLHGRGRALPVRDWQVVGTFLNRYTESLLDNAPDMAFAAFRHRVAIADVRRCAQSLWRTRSRAPANANN